MRITKRNFLLALFDTLCFWFIVAAYYSLSLILNKDFCHDSDFWIINAAVFACVFLSRAFAFETYNNVWRYTSTEAYFRLCVADVMGCIAAMILAFVFDKKEHLLYICFIVALDNCVAMASRFSYRLVYKKARMREGHKAKKDIVIIGAGQLGVYLANELKNNINSEYSPVCFVDIDKTKISAIVSGLPVFSKEKVVSVFNKRDIYAVVVAINNISGEKLEEISNYYSNFGCRTLIYDLPVYNESYHTDKRVIREFSIEDLLFRKQLSLESDGTADYYKDKIVLITGGGGSIGSELCRQVAKCGPKKLVIFDIYENNAYEIQQELIKHYGDKLNLSVEIGSVRDIKRLEYIFDFYKPRVVFHAAAHKHVPLMEQSCAEAIKNNVIGTYNTANAAEKYGVEKFILVSTDKAVNPTNIMGASKRLCEMVIQCRTDGNTSFSAVRFGNVLGSNGSVVPLFKKQIENGGPVTLTDKRIIRYFMTIPEASQLVMSAGAMAKNGQLFVLNMGNPVKIYDLAVNMIKMYGYEPEKDIKIEEIGLRPGEKLYEELLMKSETLNETPHEKIFVEKDTSSTREQMESVIVSLKDAIYRYEEAYEKNAIKDIIKKTVSTYKEPDEVNKNAKTAEEMKKLCGVAK